MEKITEEFIAECKKLGIQEIDYKETADYCEKMAKEGLSIDTKKLVDLLNKLLNLQIKN